MVALPAVIMVSFAVYLILLTLTLSIEVSLVRTIQSGSALRPYQKQYSTISVGFIDFFITFAPTINLL